MKKLLATVIALMMALSLTACGNMQAFDTTVHFDRAIISLPNGKVIEGKVDSWRDFEDGDQIQVKVDGMMYLIHASNVVLIVDKK